MLFRSRQFDAPTGKVRLNFPERDRFPTLGNYNVQQEIQPTGKLGLRRQPLTMPCLVNPHYRPLISHVNTGGPASYLRPPYRPVFRVSYGSAIRVAEP